VSEDIAEVPADDRNCDELDSTSSRLELSGAETELEEFATIHDELDSSSTEALLPSSPQATNPIAIDNMLNKPRCFILSLVVWKYILFCFATQIVGRCFEMFYILMWLTKDKI
jgi:hypothetical protein